MMALSVLVAALIYYIYYSLGVEIFLAISNSFIPSIFVVLTFAIRITNNERANMLVKVFSGLSAFTFIIVDIIMTSIQTSQPTYIIINGVLLIIVALILYSLTKAKV